MEDKELKKLKRAELIEMLFALRKRNEELMIENDVLKEKLESRIIKTKECGSLAEASLALTGIFEKAQEAADLYLENMKIRAGER